ncbi:hypothetical protein FB451DRAFT_1178037 [Mycena latifolia]|nr:hypothetical protein FB451DRAFT_1178037 [Mycena latifolia]
MCCSLGTLAVLGCCLLGSGRLVGSALGSGSLEVRREDVVWLLGRSVLLGRPIDPWDGGVAPLCLRRQSAALTKSRAPPLRTAAHPAQLLRVMSVFVNGVVVPSSVLHLLLALSSPAVLPPVLLPLATRCTWSLWMPAATVATPLVLYARCPGEATSAVVLGLDWAVLLRDMLLSSGFRLDSSFDAWAFASRPDHPISTRGSFLAPASRAESLSQRTSFRGCTLFLWICVSQSDVAVPLLDASVPGPSFPSIFPGNVSSGGPAPASLRSSLAPSSNTNGNSLQSVVGPSSVFPLASSSRGHLYPRRAHLAFDAPALIYAYFTSPIQCENIFTAAPSDLDDMLALHHIQYETTLSFLGRRHALISHLVSGSYLVANLCTMRRKVSPKTASLVSHFDFPEGQDDSGFDDPSTLLQIQLLRHVCPLVTQKSLRRLLDLHDVIYEELDKVKQLRKRLNGFLKRLTTGKSSADEAPVMDGDAPRRRARSRARLRADRLKRKLLLKNWLRSSLERPPLSPRSAWKSRAVPRHLDHCLVKRSCESLVDRELRGGTGEQEVIHGEDGPAIRRTDTDKYSRHGEYGEVHRSQRTRERMLIHGETEDGPEIRDTDKCHWRGWKPPNPGKASREDFLYLRSTGKTKARIHAHTANQLLSPAQEAVLANWTKWLGFAGFPLSRSGLATKLPDGYPMPLPSVSPPPTNRAVDDGNDEADSSDDDGWQDVWSAKEPSTFRTRQTTTLPSTAASGAAPSAPSTSTPSTSLPSNSSRDTSLSFMVTPSLAYNYPDSDDDAPPSDLDDAGLLQYLRAKNGKLRAQRNEARSAREEVDMNAILGGQHIQSLLKKLNSKKKAGNNERTLSTGTRITTSVDGRALGAAKRDAQLSPLQDLAWSLGLDEAGKREDIITRVNAHFALDHNTPLKQDQPYIGLFVRPRRRRATARDDAEPDETGPNLLLEISNLPSLPPPPPFPDAMPYSIPPTWTPPTIPFTGELSLFPPVLGVPSVHQPPQAGLSAPPAKCRRTVPTAACDPDYMHLISGIEFWSSLIPGNVMVAPSKIACTSGLKIVPAPGTGGTGGVDDPSLMPTMITSEFHLRRPRDDRVASF